MATLPSYQEATARPDWLQLASPYICFADYYSLCLINRRAWRLFAPRLWANLLESARLSGLASTDADVLCLTPDPKSGGLAAILIELDWWLDFVFNKLSSVAPATRSLARVLNFREFAKDAYMYNFASDQSGRTMDQSLKRALGLLPNVKALLLDGHTDIDPRFLVKAQTNTDQGRLSLLSVSDCSIRLPHNFFQSPSLQDLVFLDVSSLPGSVGSLLDTTVLRELRILKARNREIDDRTFIAMANTFKRRLWSLDLSGNRVTDAIVQTLTDKCFSTLDLRSSAHFQVEGRLLQTTYGTPQVGTFVFIEESSWSASFSHPERYLVDAPYYHHMTSADHEDRHNHISRSDCSCPPRQDSARSLSRLLLGDVDIDVAMDHLSNSRGLTHLSLSDNQVSSHGIDRLLRNSNGHIVYFACDKMPLLPSDGAYSRIWPKSARLYGILGKEHVFRPVFSSNLRVLRIHHSVVTSIPTLEMEHLSNRARAFLAESVILPRVQQAFPSGLLPDMNPRLTSLTLTCIPRRSKGPLIAKLIGFLQLLSLQERTIQDTKRMVSSYRSSDVLCGLQHLRLEFEPETRDDDLSVDDGFDAEGLMNSGDVGFSFFSNGTSSSVPNRQKPETSETCERDPDDREFITYHGDWQGKKFSILVWIGSKAASPNSFIQGYRSLILRHNICAGVGPVTPSQILAGAPKDGYIFHTTWYMALMPRELKSPPNSELSKMRDVVDALREYRRDGRAKYAQVELRTGKGRAPPGEPHFFWRGRLEVLC